MIEQVGKAAGSFVDAMKTNPVALALVIVNVMLLYFFYDVRKHELTLTAEHQKRIIELLTKCGEKT